MQVMFHLQPRAPSSYFVTTWATSAAPQRTIIISNGLPLYTSDEVKVVV